MSARPAGRLTSTQVQSAPDRSGFGLAFDRSEFTSGGVTAGSRLDFTCLKAPIDGIYLINAGVTWAQNATGSRAIDLHVDEGAVRPRLIAQGEIAAAPASNTADTISALERLTAGDCAGARVFQNSGSTLSVLPTGTFLAMAWVGP